MRRVALALPLVLALALGAAPRAARAQDATPRAEGTPAGGAIETLVATTFPAEGLPTGSGRAFILWHGTFAPGVAVAIPTEFLGCCPGPLLTYVAEGELEVRVDGPVRLLRAGAAGTPAPEEEVAAGTPVVLRAADAAVFDFAHPVAYANAGAAPVHLIAGGLFAAAPLEPPAGYAIDVYEEAFPAPALPPGPAAATLERATLAPGGTLPVPAAGAARVVVAVPGPATLGEESSGAVTNLGQEPVVVYALTLGPAGPAVGTPAT